MVLSQGQAAAPPQALARDGGDGRNASAPNKSGVLLGLIPPEHGE
jgi:hypothetical protein